MKTEIIAVGSELLTPDHQDTNSLFLTEGLNSIGIEVAFKSIVGDDARDLARVLRTALGRARLILCMGGLGPTEDDRTRETLAEVLGKRLVFREEIEARIAGRFRCRGLPVPPSNLKQCYVPEGALILENPHGTAPGLWLEARRRTIVLLPGPPREIRPMFETRVLPRLARPGGRPLARRVIRLTGLGESAMESLLKPVYGAVPPDVAVTTLASPGDLSIRLATRPRGPCDEAPARLDGLVRKIEAVLRPYIYSLDGAGLEAVVGAFRSPGGFFSEYWQPKHRYTLLGEEDVEGEAAYLVEAGPAGPEEPGLIYGKAWVRKRDFAIVKIEWDQRSLGNYLMILATAKSIGPQVEPRVSVVGYYGVEKNGIRFPDRLVIHEDYRSTKGIHRYSEATVRYVDYRFFIVETEVRY